MPLLMCPNCNVETNEISRSGVKLDVCSRCRGVWLDRGELEKLLSAVQRVEDEFDRDRDDDDDDDRDRDRDRDRRDRDRDRDRDQPARARRRGQLSKIFDIFGGQE
jgi:Zn-finger nucleic acid-binding protein